jgi:hypothetical protein
VTQLLAITIYIQRVLDKRRFLSGFSSLSGDFWRNWAQVRCKKKVKKKQKKAKKKWCSWPLSHQVVVVTVPLYTSPVTSRAYFVVDNKESS